MSAAADGRVVEVAAGREVAAAVDKQWAWRTAQILYHEFS